MVIFMVLTFLSFANVYSQSDQSSLSSAYDVWTAKNTGDYKYEITWACSCVSCVSQQKQIKVNNNKVTNVEFVGSSYCDPKTYLSIKIKRDKLNNTKKDTSDYYTINELFDMLLTQMKNNAYSIDVTYHEDLGYPYYALVNPHQGTSEDTFGWTINCLSLDGKYGYHNVCEPTRKFLSDLGNFFVPFLHPHLHMENLTSVWVVAGWLILAVVSVTCLCVFGLYWRRRLVQPKTITLRNASGKVAYAKMSEQAETANEMVETETNINDPVLAVEEAKPKSSHEKKYDVIGRSTPDSQNGDSDSLSDSGEAHTSPKKPPSTMAPSPPVENIA
ncbi:hypothetical protein RFI_13805 [Reticulomyxa filosa]|uniref:Uncharacterized protein n=1 Tax=Reticulomyxa filosa TaxID=46433 RepID=X6NDI5_RETFI|nr:hypothetical protein RFI_13805 [Reticulomyxa filosa]|eukprot:ETO23377.1 hypothetical protein RFI_13805 [Reticulomyxa filosa]